MPARLRPILAISAACSLVTAPLLWVQFGRVPIFGLVANALVEPVVPLLLGLAFAAAAVDPVAPPVAELIAWLNGWVAVYIATCARAVAALPGAQLSGTGAALASATALCLGAAVLRWLGLGRRR